MYLIGDIGNTETKIFYYSKNFIFIKKFRFKTLYINKKFLQKKLKFLNNKKFKFSLFCSVVPSIFRIIKRYLERTYKNKCYELKELNLSNHLEIKVNKKQIGSDRLANAISILNKSSNYIVVDFGTATNFDVIIGRKYVGGILAPGVELSLNSLSDKASLIPKIKLEKSTNVIGKNTVSALRSGFYHGYTGLIDNIIKLIIKQKKKKFRIILTGGFSNLFKNSIYGNKKVVKDLTIKGVLKVAKTIK